MPSEKLTSKPNALKKIFNWLDDNILLILGGFLLAFIPLWPKIPVWSPIEQYIVRVRLEDFFLLLTVVIWFIQVIRKKVEWRSVMFWGVLAYGIVGFLSTLSAMFITKTVPLQPLHVEKTVLNYFRYLEYFSIFFVLFSAIKKRRDVLFLIVVFALTVVGVSVYGYGQKYYYWPVYSTMNREFSKGVRLVLTPHARVQSTFGGHYDMAAFLVIALPLLLALAYKIKARGRKIFLTLTFWAGTWLLIVSASRISAVGFVLGTLIVIAMTAWERKGWNKRAMFIVTRSLLIFSVSGVLFLYFGGDLFQRIIDSDPRLHDGFHTLNRERKDFWNTYIAGGFQFNVPAPTPPPNSITTDQAIAMGVLSPSDERPIPAPTAAPARPSDVAANVPNDIVMVASQSASGAAITVAVDKGPRTYSANALQYGLSSAIRYDTLWPHAIRGFLMNPLLGEGYGTLTKDTIGQFTEADSTDNNFLRTLGETGLLGFITFYGCIVIVLYYAAFGYKNADNVEKMMSIAMISASAGLLVNAVFIDVFASSKVAFTYWALSGMFLGYSYLLQKQGKLKIPANWKEFRAELPVQLGGPAVAPAVKKTERKK